MLVNERGFIPVDRQMRTNVPHIFAIGDIAGQPMLAHKASHEGKLAAEVAHGEKRAFDARVIPSVAYTDPESRGSGSPKRMRRRRASRTRRRAFPWARERPLAVARPRRRPDQAAVRSGDASRHRRRHRRAERRRPDRRSRRSRSRWAATRPTSGLTIHPHPTLSETIMFAAEAFEGTLTDLYVPKKKPPAWEDWRATQEALQSCSASSQSPSKSWRLRRLFRATARVVSVESPPSDPEG